MYDGRSQTIKNTLDLINLPSSSAQEVTGTILSDENQALCFPISSSEIGVGRRDREIVLSSKLGSTATKKNL